MLDFEEFYLCNIKETFAATKRTLGNECHNGLIYSVCHIFLSALNKAKTCESREKISNLN